MKYKREAILRSEEFKDVQKDFLAALLVKNEYTLAEVRKLVSAFMKGRDK